MTRGMMFAAAALGALTGEVPQAALRLGGRELGEHVGGGDPLDREAAHAYIAVGPGDLDQGGRVVRGQSPDGFGANPGVAVAVLGAKQVCNPHGGCEI